MSHNRPILPIRCALLLHLSNALGALERDAPFQFLSPSQIKARSGFLFQGCDQLVFDVARALLKDQALNAGALYAGSGEDGHDLMHDYQAGALMDALIVRLELLLKAAKDTRVILKSNNTQRAMAVIAFMLREEQRAQERLDQQVPQSPQERSLLWNRRVGLRAAYGIVVRRHDTTQAKRARNRAERAAATTTAVTQTTPGALPPRALPPGALPPRALPPDQVQRPVKGRARPPGLGRRETGLGRRFLDAFSARLRDERDAANRRASATTSASATSTVTASATAPAPPCPEPPQPYSAAIAQRFALPDHAAPPPRRARKLSAFKLTLLRAAQRFCQAPQAPQALRPVE